MPMMAVYDQNDALTSARLLASSTLSELQGREDIDSSVMENMFSLLDGFRSHGFYGLEDDDDGSGDDFSAASMLNAGERRLSEVRFAMERTVVALGGDSEAVLDDVETALRAAAYPREAVVDQQAKARALDFLASLIANLRKPAI